VQIFLSVALGSLGEKKMVQTKATLAIKISYTLGRLRAGEVSLEEGQEDLRSHWREVKRRRGLTGGRSRGGEVSLKGGREDVRSHWREVKRG